MGCCGNSTIKSTPQKSTAQVLDTACRAGFRKATYTGPAGYVVTENGNAYGTQATGAVICILDADADSPLFN